MDINEYYNYNDIIFTLFYFIFDTSYIYIFKFNQRIKKKEWYRRKAHSEKNHTVIRKDTNGAEKVETERRAHLVMGFHSYGILRSDPHQAHHLHLQNTQSFSGPSLDMFNI